MKGKERIERLAGPLILAAALIYAAIMYPTLFLRHPPVWPDEGLFANPGIEWLRHGVLRTSLIGDLIEGMGTRTYWVPPAYLAVIAGVFKVFGIGVVQMRLFSVICGIGSICLVWLITRKLSEHRWIPWAAASLLLIDPNYIRAMTIGRMDIMAIFLGLASVFTHLKYRIAWLSGFLAGLALITHPMGGAAVAAVFFSLLMDRKDARRFRNLLLAALGLSIALLPWVIYILQDSHSFFVQFWGQFVRKADRPNIGWRFLLVPFDQYGGESIQFLGLTVYIIALFTHLKRQGQASILFWWGASAFALAALSREMWYGPYLTPCLAIGLFMATEAAHDFGRYVRPAAVVLSLLWIYHLGTYLDETYRNYKNTYKFTDYQAYCSDISKHIPKGSKVILSAIPDPYLGLAGRKDLKVYHFIPGGVPVDPWKYQERLSTVDFYVITDQLSSTEVGEYARENGDLSGIVGEPGNGYSALIYERRGR